jgi:GNAT superfamily N-acetyltransferase
MFISTLAEYPHLIPKIARIYMNEWGWHYESEYGITTLKEMIDDIVQNHTHNIAVLMDAESCGEFIGTFAILGCDLVAYAHLSPWFASLYVEPQYRNKGVGKMLVDFACNELVDGMKLYLWCYREREKQLYERWGFVVHDSFVHPPLDAMVYVMSKGIKK